MIDFEKYYIHDEYEEANEGLVRTAKRVIALHSAAHKIRKENRDKSITFIPEDKSEFETFVDDQIKSIIPKYEELKLIASVTSSSYSIEFFVKINGKKMQCFEMIDSGMISEKQYNSVCKEIARYIREQPNFNSNKINKYSLRLK